MAYVRDIDRKCYEPECASGAVVQVISETDYSTVGEYCRPCGRKVQKAVDAQDRQHKEKAKDGTGDRPLRGVSSS